MSGTRACAAIVGVMAASGSAAAQGYDDGRGREWRQINQTMNLTWDQVAGACLTDGATPCDGIVAGRDLTGWVWATQGQVRELFADWQPEILAQPSLSGPEYMLSALGFLSGPMQPTWSFYTTFGGYLYGAGWTSTLDEDGFGVMPAVSAQYPVYNGTWTVAGSAAPTTVHVPL